MSPPTLPSRLSETERALARVGKVVHQYRIDRLIGIGGMAAVYAATHRDGQQVAVKFMLERFRDDASIVQLFGREALIANQVGHPGAVPVLGHDEDGDGGAYLVMPLLIGETLGARWLRAKKRLPLSEAGLIMSDVLDVLARAHDVSIVHRDIKPENIFLTATGDVRVLDFGIARRIDHDGNATITGITIGTPAFMPPEQAIGDRSAIGPHSDCWAAGATIFTLLSGEFVHVADNAAAQLAAAATRPARSLAEIAPNLPRSIGLVVDKALAFDPTHRWRSAREMRDALIPALEEALGERVARVSSQLRVELVEEWSRGAAATGVKKAAPPAVASPSPVSRLALAGIETNIRDIARAMRILPAVVHEIYAKHGLGRFTATDSFVSIPGPWPTEIYAACIHEIAITLGPIKTFELHKLVHRYVAYHDGDASGEDIHTAFQLADVRFHLGHRKHGQPMYDAASGEMLEGIGHLHYRGEPGENFIAIESDAYAPCDMQRGAQFFVARRYEPHSVVEHAPGPCRKRGDASCIYHITWW